MSQPTRADSTNLTRVRSFLSALKAQRDCEDAAWEGHVATLLSAATSRFDHLADIPHAERAGAQAAVIQDVYISTVLPFYHALVIKPWTGWTIASQPDHQTRWALGRRLLLSQLQLQRAEIAGSDVWSYKLIFAHAHLYGLLGANYIATEDWGHAEFAFRMHVALITRFISDKLSQENTHAVAHSCWQLGLMCLARNDVWRGVAFLLRSRDLLNISLTTDIEKQHESQCERQREMHHMLCEIACALSRTYTQIDCNRLASFYCFEAVVRQAGSLWSEQFVEGHCPKAAYDWTRSVVSLAHLLMAQDQWCSCELILSIAQIVSERLKEPALKAQIRASSCQMAVRRMQDSSDLMTNPAQYTQILMRPLTAISDELCRASFNSSSHGDGELSAQQLPALVAARTSTGCESWEELQPVLDKLITDLSVSQCAAYFDSHATVVESAGSTVNTPNGSHAKKKVTESTSMLRKLFEGDFDIAKHEEEYCSSWFLSLGERVDESSTAEAGSCVLVPCPKETVLVFVVGRIFKLLPDQLWSATLKRFTFHNRAFFKAEFVDGAQLSNGSLRRRWEPPLSTDKESAAVEARVSPLLAVTESGMAQLLKVVKRHGTVALEDHTSDHLQVRMSISAAYRLWSVHVEDASRFAGLQQRRVGVLAPILEYPVGEGVLLEERAAVAFEAAEVCQEIYVALAFDMNPVLCPRRRRPVRSDGDNGSHASENATAPCAAVSTHFSSAVIVQCHHARKHGFKYYQQYLDLISKQFDGHVPVQAWDHWKAAMLGCVQLLSATNRFVGSGGEAPQPSMVNELLLAVHCCAQFEDGLKRFHPALDPASDDSQLLTTVRKTAEDLRHEAIALRKLL